MNNIQSNTKVSNTIFVTELEIENYDLFTISKVVSSSYVAVVP
jgi:hypothetical protein